MKDCCSKSQLVKHKLHPEKRFHKEIRLSHHNFCQLMKNLKSLGIENNQKCVDSSTYKKI
ncbi:CLUMA_CG006455, isoform A [Clunio marinus]|uniref:CLUMA_CG006455, isoform A n=1 Tax=Clunio marinus TaxID=568069 RepID=A0A1J1I383_9DIPT|nr:CLUMA_CG006455, isoform A [Clunio marinus]